MSVRLLCTFCIDRAPLRREFMDTAHATIIVSVECALAVRYMTLVSMTVLALDWIILLGEEVELIWKSKRLLGKVFYFAVRYPTFIDVSLTVVYYFTPGLSSANCLVEYRAGVCLASIGTACTELVLIWRTYALYNRSKKILVSLGVLWTIWVLGNVYPVAKFVRSVVFASQQLPKMPGCYLVNGDDIVFLYYATLLAMEVVIVVLTVYEGIRSFRTTKSPLVITLYRDGVLFFLLVTGFSLGNVLTLLVAPIEFIDLLNTLARVMHTVLCSRVIIHLRSAAQQVIEPPTHLALSTKSGVHFRYVDAGTINEITTVSGVDQNEVVELSETTHAIRLTTSTLV